MVCGALGLREVHRLTAARFSLTLLPLAMGLFTLLVFVAMLVGLASQPPEDVFSYGGLALPGRTDVVPEAQDYSMVTSLAITIFASIFFGGCLAGSAFIYCTGINEEGTGRYDRRPDEPDAMGALIASSLKDKQDSQSMSS
jgi:hypothetical protein